MSDFPRTAIEGVSVSRMIIGTNWFLGFSHTSRAKDRQIVETMTRERIADVLEVFFRAGIDTILGVRPESQHLEAAVRDVEDRTGRECIRMTTPHLGVEDGGEDTGEIERILDAAAGMGARFCMPHQCSTDALTDRTTRTIRGMDRYCAMIRERGMIPGLSTHMPETPVYADENDLDVATYVQIYNAAGFLMQIEVDWVHRMIWNARRPVITIKPMAAGRVHPLVGMAFNWSTIRERDMVCVGTMTPDEARELIDLSLAMIERRGSTVELQKTRSKTSVAGRS